MEQRRPIGPPETDWARAYERSLLRKWARFPLDGDIYEALEDTLVKFLTHWAAPFTDGGSGILPKGTQIRVEVFSPEPIGVYAQPIDREVIEDRLVKAGDRANEKYRGFSLKCRRFTFESLPWGCRARVM